jgi:hypothetical protein
VTFANATSGGAGCPGACFAPQVIPTALTLGGTGAANFLILTDGCTGKGDLFSGATCSATIAMFPQSTGQKIATVSLTSGASSATASFTGN